MGLYKENLKYPRYKQTMINVCTKSTLIQILVKQKFTLKPPRKINKQNHACVSFYKHKCSKYSLETHYKHNQDLGIFHNALVTSIHH